MHFGHYISGSAHAGILSWLLVGSWFVPPEPSPFESVSVAMISSAELAAMNMSDEEPETAQFTSEVVAPSEQEELDLQIPSQIQSISQVAEIEMISIKEIQETQPQKPKPLRVPSPSFAENIPSLNSPSENDFALLQSPEVIDAPQPANRISKRAIAPPPPDVKVDDRLLETALPPYIAPSPVEEKPKEEDVTSTIQPNASGSACSVTRRNEHGLPCVYVRVYDISGVTSTIHPSASGIACSDSRQNEYLACSDSRRNEHGLQ